MNPTCKRLSSLMLMLSPLTGAQESIPSPTTDFVPTAWTVQAPERDSKIISARIEGMAAHADETSIAILHVACYRSPLRPVISLYTHTDELRFNPNIYEGPDARSTGPLSLTTGALPPTPTASRATTVQSPRNNTACCSSSPCLPIAASYASGSAMTWPASSSG
ncbi:hypothetical protein LRS56_24765 [Pseudomonas poae]|nr:hypothetical protein LRS56_24765 [Pseudomonas poae]